jgi:L-malate glycosyltransferase
VASAHHRSDRSVFVVAPRGRLMRIGVTCYPTFGGSGVVATELGLLLAARGHQVHFISTDVPARLDRFVENVFFHAVETRDYPLFDSPYALALASKMVEVTTWEKLDVLHVHYAIPHATSAYLARQILGDAAPRLVTTLHGTDSTLVGNDPTFLPVTRFSIVKSDVVTAPSQFLADITRQNFGLPGFPIRVIPNFVDTKLFAPPDARDLGKLAHLFRAPSLLRRRLIVHSSNFRPLKRVDQVMRIFAEVRARHVHEDVCLALIGDGPERSKVSELARQLGVADHVSFLGKQLHFKDVLCEADVFLLPSENESFGVAALEALACGVPVVASHVGGLPEVVDDGVTGALCAVNDVSAFAAAVVRLLSDEPLRQELGRSARTQAATRWPIAATVSAYEAALGG